MELIPNCYFSLLLRILEFLWLRIDSEKWLKIKKTVL